MTEKIDIQGASDSALGVYWKRISSAFGVGISQDGGGVAITGDDSLSVLRAKSVLSALSGFAREGEIEETLPDYLIFLAKSGKLEDAEPVAVAAAPAPAEEAGDDYGDMDSYEEESF